MGTAALRHLRPAAQTGLALAWFAVLLGLPTPVSPAHAQSVDELNARISAAQDQARQLAARIEARRDEVALASSRAQAAAQREAELTAVLGRSRQREAQLAAEVAAAQENLDTARSRLARATRALTERLIAIYKSGVPDATRLLLHADGFDDLATRADLLDRIRSADASLVARVRELRAELATRLAEVSEARERAEEHTQRVADARNRIASVRAAAESEAAGLLAARERERAALSGLRSRVGEWTAQVEAAQRISAEQAQHTVATWVGEWAIPRAIVMCESGGNFQALNPGSGAGGAYQILPSTWRAYGGSGLPHQASPAEQHRIATLIWRDSGSAAWVC